MAKAFLTLEDQRGVGIIIMLGMVLLLVYFCALVIDLGRAEYTVHCIQRSVDAAALAGAAELVLGGSNDLKRWKNTKRAVLGMLKSVPITPHYTLPDLTVSGYHVGDTDQCESSGNYRWQVYDNGEVRVEIERGVFSEDSGSPSFDPLESPSDCNASADPPANAVRVTVSIYEFPNYFAGVLPIGRPTFPLLQRSAIGTQVK